MKKYIYTLLFSLLLGGLVSCSKWLDVKPGAQVPQEELFSTEAGYIQALRGSYIQLGAGLYQDNLTMTTISAMAQNYQATTSGHPLMEHARYNYAAPVVKASISTIWTNMYKAIGGLNNILGHIDQSKNVFSDRNYRLIKGESLGLRAYLHFDLLRMYGPVPIGGDNVNAIPYCKTFDKLVTPLSTTAKVIELCLNDLNEAEQLLSVYQDIIYDEGVNTDEFTSYTRNHFNYWAVKALKARVYLYAGNKVKALECANEVINSGKFPFIDRATFSLTANQDRTFSTEHVFALSLPLIKPLVDTRFRPEGTTTFLASTFYLPTATMNTLFDVATGGATDYRYLYHIRTSGAVSYSTKFWQDGLSNLQLIGQMPLIRLSEMYYIAAEATTDLTEARTLLNKVRLNRGLEALTTPFTASTRMQEIGKEYIKEFYAEGQLYFYYKRLNTLPIPRATPAMTAQTYVFPMPDLEIEFGDR